MKLGSIQLDLTSRCNLGCEFCPFHGTEGIIDEGSELPYEVYKRLVDDLTTLLVKPTVKLAGSGEPTIYRYFDLLLAYMHERGLPVRLITNGTTLQSKAKIAARILTQLVVSIHGEREEHDTIVHRTGAYDNAYAGITQIRALNPDLDIIHHTVITPGNYEGLGEIAQRAVDYRTRPRFQHLKFTPGNNALGGFNIQLLTEILKSIKAKYPPTLVEPDMEPDEIVRYYDVRKPFVLNPHACWRVLFDVPVRYNGDVMRCDGVPMGNIQHESILTIVQGEQRKKFVEMVQESAASETGLPSFCSRCCYNSKKPVTAFSSIGDGEPQT